MVAGTGTTAAAMAVRGGAAATPGARVLAFYAAEQAYFDAVVVRVQNRFVTVRFLGYANELGESFKPLIPRVAYFGTYGVACAYVAADANDKYQRDGDVARGVDALVWQALASVIVPEIIRGNSSSSSLLT